MHAGAPLPSSPPLDPTALPHRLRLRVYWEDTDAGGIVYYANYLRFFERARSEWLRALGVQQERLRQDSRLLFVVADVALHYHRAARLDDELDLGLRVARLGRVSIDLEQSAWRGAERLVDAQVRIGCVSLDGLVPRRIPRFILDHIKP